MAQIHLLNHSLLSDTVTDTSFNIEWNNLKQVLDKLYELKENGSIYVMNYSQRKETVSSSTRPVTPIIGMCVFDETLKKPIWYNGTNWIDATGITV